MPLDLPFFAPLVGARFAVDGTEVQLVLTAAADASRPGGPAGFALEFTGPAAPALPQGTYPLCRDGWREEIFIVPLGPQGEAMLYEAVFN